MGIGGGWVDIQIKEKSLVLLILELKKEDEIPSKELNGWLVNYMKECLIDKGMV
ncbi:MAG: hypothetical protein AAF600_11775 [Bacteroidota bacterium]